MLNGLSAGELMWWRALYSQEVTEREEAESKRGR
jgi:hypothetical protein